MKCNGKKCFTKKDCQSKLNSLIKSGEWSAKQKGRIYHCPECDWWHLTSKPILYKTNMTGVKISFVNRWKNLLKK